MSLINLRRSGGVSFNAKVSIGSSTAQLAPIIPTRTPQPTPTATPTPTISLNPTPTPTLNPTANYEFVNTTFFN